MQLTVDSDCAAQDQTFSVAGANSVGTAVCMDRNQIRIFQPTLGFLGATGKTNMVMVSKTSEGLVLN